jgi:CRISPR-associated protein Csa2
MFLSMSFRLRVEVEALNMVEAMGAYSRHRTVSLLKPRGDGKGYRLVIAPAVSGQAIAYGYMKTLATLAQQKNLPVCEQCKSYEVKGGFVKHGIDEEGDEEQIVKNCIVEDVTGFMIAKAGVRRTSAIHFSYMVPDIDVSEVAIEPQFHVRAAKPGEKPQPFQVEAGTAIYVLGIALDIDKVGVVADKDGKPRVVVDNRLERMKMAIQAVAGLIEGLVFGAKKARYLPVYEVVGAVATLSHPVPFMVSPARVSKDGNYIVKTLSRAENFVKLFNDVNEWVKLFYMDKEGVVQEVRSGVVGVNKVDSVSELVAKIIATVEENFKG